MTNPEESAARSASLPPDLSSVDASSAGTSSADEPSADPAASSEEAFLALAALKRKLNRLQREIRLAIQEQLSEFSGQSLGSIDANRELVRSVQATLDSHGLRVRCAQCGQPAILRVSPRKGADAGVFVFDHTIDGRRTFHGGRTVLPEIRLVAKPPRKTRSRVSSGSSEATDAVKSVKSAGGAAKRKRGGRVAG